MARWRAVAHERFPELRKCIAEAPEIMAFWLELTARFHQAYRTPRDDDFIRRVYQFADWCMQAPRNSDAGRDPPTAVMVAFYEHIPQNAEARRDMPRWFRYSDVAASKSVFAYHIGEKAFTELLEYMAQHKHEFRG